MSEYDSGYLGNAKYKGNEKLYSVWKSMIRRCNCDKHIRYNCYKNVTVDERWLCFEYFLEYVVKLKNWNEEKFYNNDLQLDKDYKQQGIKNKTYSKFTCIWLEKKKNNCFQPNHCKKFKIILPNGKEKIYYSQHLCAKENNLNVTLINKCLNGTRKTHKGNMFEYC